MAVIIISSSGRVDDLLAVADVAREGGAAVEAIIASHSALAKKAEVALIVDDVEDVATHLPMVNRILHLLVIDLLAVGVALRLGADQGADQGAALGAEAREGLDEALPLPAQPPTAHRVAPGMSMAGPLARLTSHSG